MSKLPTLSGAQVVKALEGGRVRPDSDAGEPCSDAKSDHWTWHNGSLHKVVKRGTLAAILRQAGLDVAEFVELL